MGKIEINTFIGRKYCSNFPEGIAQAIPITNPLAVDKAQKILEENEGDYLFGFVSLIYNDAVIFGEEQLTESLLETWSDIIYIFDSHYDGRIHGIDFLDNCQYLDTVIQIIDQYYEIKLDSSHCFLVPIEPFKNEVKKEFFNFVEFCKNEKLQFSKESSYRGLLETYEELIQNEEEKT